MEQPIIRVEGLKKTFKVSRKKIIAVDDVSFSVKKGSTLGLVGESGCGKSTIGRILVGLFRPDEGSVFFRNIELTAMSKEQRRKFAPKIQLVFQSPYASLNPAFSIENILLDGLYYHNLLSKTKSSCDKVAELLDMVELPDKLASRYPHELSGGQCQRIGIARALSLNPEFLVCDEITSALDLNAQAQILNLLLKLQQQLGLSILFISHDIRVVEHMSDYIAVMRQGVIEEYGVAEKICKASTHPYTQRLLAASGGAL